MAISSSSAMELAAIGANIIITPKNKYPSDDVKEIIKIALSRDKTVTIYAGSYTLASLKDFVRLGKDKVTIAI
jgi:hypothetical protein